jgi:hypothetical protein
MVHVAAVTELASKGLMLYNCRQMGACRGIHSSLLSARLHRCVGIPQRVSPGYTIIEVSLFLAVSGLLVLIALIGTGTTIQATRFTDSSRSLHAYVQKQYDDILNGVDTRSGDEACSAGVVDTSPATGQPVGTTTCLLLGKLVVFTQSANTVQSYTIIGTEPASPDYTKSDEALIYDFQPTIVRNLGVDTYTIPWGATVSGSKRSIDATAVDALAFIRSPRSNRIVAYVFKQPAGSYSLAPLINPATPANAFNKSSNTSNFCLKSADVFGVLSKITLTGGQGQDAVDLQFEAVAGDCNGA